MPEKSLSHRSKATPAGHPASPSGTEPFDRGPGSAGGPLGVRRSGTEPPVTTEGAKTVQESSQRRTLSAARKAGTPTFTCQQVTPRLTAGRPD